MCAASIPASQGDLSPTTSIIIYALNILWCLHRTPLTAALREMAAASFDRASKELREQYSESFLDVFDAYLEPILEVIG